MPSDQELRLRMSFTNPSCRDSMPISNITLNYLRAALPHLRLFLEYNACHPLLHHLHQPALAGTQTLHAH